jgi:lambda family phage portal protein
VGITSTVLSAIDRLTGADRRARRRVVEQVASSPSISQRRAESIAARLGEEIPESHRRWESAKTTRLNHGHWANVNGQPINAELSGWLNDLRHRSEYEVANNSLVEGMIQTYQLCVVGSNGPHLSVLSSDKKYAAQRQALWENWAQSPATNQQLSLVEILDHWIRSCFSSGEFFDQMVTVRDVTGPVKMRLLPIHSRRLMTPPQFLGRPDVAMGVRRDLEFRRPLAYFISQPYVMGSFELYTGEFKEIPYADALHGFRMIEEDQVRGVPWLASCLDPIAELRDFKIETLDAARAAADQAVLLYTEHVDAPFIQTNENVRIERRTQRNLPPGWRAEMVSPAHPGPQYDSFYESLAREIGGPICMPLMMLLLDSSSHNYSSARFDGQLYWRGVAKTQGWLGRVLTRIESAVAREAELAGELPPPPKDMRRRFNWPSAPHVDPTKERTADRMGLENGDLTYSELCAASGRLRDEVIAERKADNEALIAAGLPPIPGIETGNGQQVAAAAYAHDDEDDQPKGNRKKADAARMYGRGVSVN